MFGYWKVLEKTTERYVLCECQGCPQESRKQVKLDKHRLIRGITKSCGCKNIEQGLKTKQEKGLMVTEEKCELLRR